MIIEQLANEQYRIENLKKFEVFDNKIIYLPISSDSFLLISGASLVKVEAKHNIYISNLNDWKIHEHNEKLYLKHRTDYDNCKKNKVYYSTLNKKIIFKRWSNFQAFVIDFLNKTIDVYTVTKDDALGEYDTNKGI